MFCGLCWGQGMCDLLLFSGGRRTCFEPEAVVPGFQDVAAVGKAVEQAGGHLGITEDAGPFAESEIGGDDDAGAFGKLAQQMEEQDLARGAER